MTRPAQRIEPGLPDSAARSRFQERLYVILQILGWGFLLAVQCGFGLLFSPPNQRAQVIYSSLQVSLSGLLISHAARAYIKRRGWTKLNLGPLIPRVLAFSLIISAVWVSALSSWQHLVLGWSYPPGPNPFAFAAMTIVNTAIVLAGWFGFYFFYHVFARYNRAEVEKLQLIASAKNSELRALKSQLNPHFIFNSLNSLRSLIEEDPQRARTAVTQLANLLRYSLQSAQLETVDFNEELKVVTDYLALEQVRHEERLRVRLDIPPETLHWPVPPLLLQTIVENAVKYGISSRQAGGEIAIVARVEQGALVLQVTNPGELIPPKARTNSTGVGLANAGERLRLIFGEQSSLSLTRQGVDTVLATAIIPLQTTKSIA